MSLCRQEVFIDAPPRIVWALLSDVDRHEDWWAGIVEVECEGLDTGCTYRQVNTNPFGRSQEDTLRVEQMEECDELLIRCVDTGTFVHFVLAEAQGGTFLAGEAGMEAARIPHRIWDRVAGKRWFRDWLAKSLESISEISARERSRPA